MSTANETAEPNENAGAAPVNPVASETPEVMEAPAAAVAPLTEAEIEELKVKAAKAAENWDRLLRATADFDNYKKRAAREREEAVKFANESLLSRLLPVLDNFEMALAALSQSPEGGNAQSLKSGVQMISQQLKTTLQEFGLEEIPIEGKPFDPNLHEAVSQQESADVEEGAILQQLRKGYKLRERLIRPSTVILAKKPSS